MCGAYLLATARLTVGDARDFLGDFLDHHGLQRIGTVIEEFSLRAMMDWQTRQNGVLCAARYSSLAGWAP